MIFSLFKRMAVFCARYFAKTLIVGTTVGCLFIFFVAVAGEMVRGDANLEGDSRVVEDIIYGTSKGSHHFLSIPITGFIVGDQSDIGAPLGFLNESITMGYRIKDRLRQAAEDDTLSGIVLEINSSGGTIYGAKAIADGVAIYREKTKKPIIAFVSGLAASGAYWAAVSADEVIADLGTSVGSIGVISGPFQYFNTVIAQSDGAFSGGVVTEKGIENIYITAGKSKDIGNPYRKLTSEEIESLQTMVNHEYDSFVAYVSQRRSISEVTIKNSLGALLYDGKSAVNNKLIDRIGSRDEAYTLIAQKAGIENEDFYVTKETPRLGILQNILQSKGLLGQRKGIVQSCALSHIHLVYHGDISSLCSVQ